MFFFSCQTRVRLMSGKSGEALSLCVTERPKILHLTQNRSSARRKCSRSPRACGRAEGGPPRPSKESASACHIKEPTVSPTNKEAVSGERKPGRRLNRVEPSSAIGLKESVQLAQASTRNSQCRPLPNQVQAPVRRAIARSLRRECPSRLSSTSAQGPSFSLESCA